MTHVDLIALTKTYPNQGMPVLNEFSLSVENSEMVALLGPSGSGKSTLLKLIAGIERPDAGDIRFDGASILRVPSNKRGAVFMFQKAYLFPFLTVADNIGFGLKVQKVPAETIRQEVARMLDLIGLPGIQSRKPAQLSGGEQQRVALARALVTRPKLLLLDEPLSSLDTEVRLNLQAAIRRIQREMGITTILVTHDLGEAMAMSDRLALLKEGSVIAVDQPEVLFHRPPNQAAAQFMGVSTFLQGRQTAGKLEMPFGSLKIAGCTEKDCPGTYAIRPEHICVQSQPGSNTLAGQVIDCVFRGEYIEYQVAVGEMDVRARMPMPAPMHAQHAQVYVQFPEEQLFEVQNWTDK
ncbi:MAG: ABC transporter ATP-binding protein [Anaerolineales bacterium]|nr:ABC transporter ATP-binding protein [Anaerolineales bacterium]